MATPGATTSADAQANIPGDVFIAGDIRLRLCRRPLTHPGTEEYNPNVRVVTTQRTKNEKALRTTLGNSVCFLASSLGPVHFGLGSETEATRVDIVWPSGIVQHLANVRADQLLKVAESGANQHLRGSDLWLADAPILNPGAEHALSARPSIL